jgi:hypothetical protein
MVAPTQPHRLRTLPLIASAAFTAAVLASALLVSTATGRLARDSQSGSICAPLLIFPPLLALPLLHTDAAF